MAWRREAEEEEGDGRTFPTARTNRVLLALAISVAMALVFLVLRETLRNYPAEDGFVLQSGELMGGDFIAFYVSGRLFRQDRGRLYDFERQREMRNHVLGPHVSARPGEFPSVYPPLVPALLAPFSLLPFQQAFAAWTLFGLLASLGGLVLLMRASGTTDIVPLPVLLLFCLGFLPFSMNALAGGQIAWLGILTLALVATALLGRRDFLAGLAMSLSYYKPPLFLLLLAVLCLARGRRFLAGFLSGGAVLLAATLAAVGPGGVMDFFSAASRYTYGQSLMEGVELPPSEGMGLVALVYTAVPSLVATVAILAVPALLLGALGWRLLGRGCRDDTLLGLVLTMTASLALSLQLIKYDLALLLVPMALGLAWAGRRPGMRRALVLAPFLGFYFEFAFRRMGLGGAPVNAASFLFVAVLALLGGYAWLSAGREAAGRPVP